MEVMIIGPSVTGTKGGMATVIKDMLANSNPEIHFRHIVSHSEGSGFEKIVTTIKAVVQFITAPRFDLVHIHLASGASMYRKSIFVLLSRIMGKPVVIHNHGADFDTFYLESSGFAKWYIRKIFSMCQKVLVLSGFWKSFFQNTIKSKNVEVLHNGVYTSVFEACYTMPQNLSRFLFLGRLGKRKGVYDLLESVDELVNRQGHRDLYFYLAGDGDLEEVQELVKRKGLENNVELLGWIGEKEKLESLKHADTMILPSYNEGLPMSILESMAAGKVIISSRVGGIPDLVTEGENGYLIDPGDIGSMSKHILYVKQHPEEMIRIAENNKLKIEQEYNLARLNERLFSFYKQALGSKG